MDLQHLYIDGSKFEANANKYSWVWKKATEKSRYCLFDKITKLLQEINEEISCTGTRLCINTEYAPEYLKESAGKYAHMKKDRWYKRIVRRGTESVRLEIFLVSIEQNLYKFHNKKMRTATAA